MKLDQLPTQVRLGLAFGSVILLSLAGGLMSLLYLNEIQSNTSAIVLDNNHRVKLVHQLGDEQQKILHHISTLVLLRDPLKFQAEESDLRATNERYDVAWDELLKTKANEHLIELRHRVAAVALAARGSGISVIDLARAGLHEQASQSLFSQLGMSHQAWDDALKRNIRYQEDKIKQQHAESLADFQATRLGLVLGNGLGLLLGLFLSWRITKSMTRQLGGEPSDASLLASRVAAGDFSNSVLLRPGDNNSMMAQLKAMSDQVSKIYTEITRVVHEIEIEGKLGGRANISDLTGSWKNLIESFNQHIASTSLRIRTISEVATSVSQGDFTRSLSGFEQGEPEILQRNINQMIRKLKESTAAQIEHDWLKSNLEKLTRLMSGQRELRGACELLLSELATLLSVGNGAIYHVQANREPTRQGAGQLILQASYGAQAGLDLPRKLASDQGLVGTCAQQRKRILLSSVPADYVQINSALGSSPPLTLVVFPIVFDGQSKAVIELASFEPFSPVHLDFLDQLAESFGVTLNSIEIYAHTEQTSQYARSLIEASLDPLVTISPEGKITDVNEGSIKITGVPREQLIGTDFSNYFTEPDQAREGYQQVFAKGSVTDYPLTVRHQDGQLTDVLYNASVYKDAAGNVLGVFAAARDVTERKKVEQLLQRKNKELEIASRAKSDFLANMSHEIRTPMNAIIGMTYLAQQTQPEPKLDNYLNKITQASKQLLGIINNILDSSKIEAGKLELEEIEFSFIDVLTQLGDILNLKADERDIELLFDIDPGLPTMLRGDPLRLGQILLNLGNNAVKFSEGGKITISVREPAPARVDSGHKMLEFTVKDSGIGMTPEQCQQLFQPFTQVDSSITRKFGGTGLGLAIAKSLVELMNGKIWVESQPGVGSVFRFSARFGVVQAPILDYQHIQLKDKHLLVVDDIAEAREVFATVATGFGMQVETAAGGEQALELLKNADQRQQAFDLLLTDWKMPGIDGVTLLLQLQQLKLKKVPPILMVTAYRREELLEKIKRSAIDCSQVLSKPVNPSALYNALLQAVQPDSHSTLEKTVGTQKAAAFNQRNLAGKRVLLVEDNDLNQELAAELLRQAALVVTVAGDGRQALAAMASEPAFDAVLMDCHMPVMDGYQATLELRKNPAWTALPVIALTADAMKGTNEKVLAAGMNDYLTKPLDVAKLYATLDHWIAASSAPASAQVPTETDIQINAKPQQAGETEQLGTLPELPAERAGLDQVAGLRICNGNRDLYTKLLTMFHQGQADFCQRFDAAKLDADPQAAQRCAHSLKGSAANIGAKAVAAIAAELEQACKVQASPTIIDALRDKVGAELKTVLSGLAQFQQQ